MQVQDYHVGRPAESVGILQPASPVTTWMPGTRPGMTLKALCKSLNLAPMGLVPAIHVVTGPVGIRIRTILFAAARAIF